MKLHINWNALGFSAALICAIHCALFPLLINVVPLLGVSFLNNVYFEILLLLIAVLIGGSSLWHGYRRHHHHILPLLFFSSGMIFYIINQWNHQQYVWLILPAIILIMTAYFLNWRFCRKAKHCHATDCNH